MAKPKDVVVIGAGPAGAAAATVCARAGLDVIVLTQEHRTAVRAVESLHAGVESVMDYLGAAEALRIACCSRYRGIWVNKEFVPLGQDPSGPWLGYHVDRRQLDSELCAAAVRSGAVIRYSSVRSASIERGRASTVILHSGELVPARWIIDASGYRCC